MTICHAKQEDEKELVFKFGFVGEFEKMIVGTGVPDGPLPNSQKHLSDLRYFGPSRTPVPTVLFLRFIQSDRQTAI